MAPRSYPAHERRRLSAAGIVASAPANRDRVVLLHDGTGRAGIERTNENLWRRRFRRGSEPDAGGRFHRVRIVCDFTEPCRGNLGSFRGRHWNYSGHRTLRMYLAGLVGPALVVAQPRGGFRQRHSYLHRSE